MLIESFHQCLEHHKNRSQNVEYNIGERTEIYSNEGNMKIDLIELCNRGCTLFLELVTYRTYTS